MMQKALLLGVGLGLLLSLGLGQVAFAQSKEDLCRGAGGVPTSDGGCVSPGDDRQLPDVIRSVTNILVFIVGVAAVIVLIIGGLRYVLSGGDQAGVEGAKNTILYAVIGIIVAFMAYAIVNFVLQSLR